jgi:hypothetical protein
MADNPYFDYPGLNVKWGSSPTLTSLNIVPSSSTATSTTVAPTGNEAATFAGLNIQNTAISPTLREFSLVAGITSSQPLGTDAGTNNDKVAIYGGTVANHSGTASDANTWAANFLEVMNTGYTGIGQIVEFDLNNNTGSDRLTSTTNPNSLSNYSLGVEVSGAGTNRNTTAYAINGAKWQYGYMALSDISQAAFYENVNSVYGLDLEGAHTVGLAINMAGLTPHTSGAIVARNGTDEQVVVRVHQNLSSGSAISSINDAGVAFTPLEIQASTLLLSQGPVSFLNVTTPASPPVGQFYLYCDVADGKLKAKGSSGTVTVLALP